MKKSIFTFALLSLVVLTSFTTLQETGDDDAPADTTTPTTTTNRRDTGGGSGNQDVGGNKKHDLVEPIPFTSQYPNQDIPSRRKSDF